MVGKNPHNSECSLRMAARYKTAFNDNVNFFGFETFFTTGLTCGIEYNK